MLDVNIAVKRKAKSENQELTSKHANNIKIIKYLLSHFHLLAL